MFKIVSPTEVIVILFLGLLSISAYIEDTYPSVSLILIGLFIGLYIGAIWQKLNNELFQKNNFSLNSSYIVIDELLISRTKLFYIWLTYKIIFTFFIGLGIFSAFMVMGIVLNSATEYGWLIRVVALLTVGILATAISCTPFFIYLYLSDESKNNILSKHIRLLKKVESIIGKKN